MKKKAKILAIDQFVPHINQIRVVTFMCTTFGTTFIFTKTSNVAKWFFDICNAVLTKIGRHFVNKVIAKLKLSKNVVQN